MSTINFFIWCLSVAILCIPGLFMTAIILSGCHVKEIQIFKKWHKINYKSWKFWALYIISIALFVLGLLLVKEGPLT